MLGSLRLHTLMLLASAWTTPTFADCGQLLPHGDSGAGPPRQITASDLIELRQVGLPDASLGDASVLAISPDGNFVAFQLSRADIASNSYCNGLAVVGLDGHSLPRLLDQGGEFVPVTAFVRELSVEVGLPMPLTPAWSPDGRSIAYLRREKGVTQLFVASAGGGAGRQLTHGATDIEAVSWLSDDRLLVTTRPTLPAAESAIDAEGLTGWLYDARIATNEGVRPRVRESDVPAKQFAVDLASGTMSPARGDAAQGVGEGSAKGAAKSLWRASLRQEGDSLVSPERLWATSAGGRQVPCSANACLGGISEFWWQPDGRTLRFLRREGWNHERYAFYDWQPGKAPIRLSATEDVVQNCVPSAARLICTAENATTPRRIVSIDPRTGARYPIFDPNPEFTRVRLGRVERLRWRNDKGLEAWGDLVLPPDYRPGTALPLIVVQYHSRGFLRGGTGDEYPIYLFAQRGFAVLSFERPPDVTQFMPHLRTEVELNAASDAGWAERKSMLSSLLTGLQMAVATGSVDPRRIGITGLSDGATSARFALINSKAFAAAAISSCCVEPKTSMTYGGIAWADYNRSVGYPPASVDDPTFWRPASLALNAARIKTPLLMQLSDDEYLLSLEAFEALREHHAPVELYVYPGEHHVKWQPIHRLAVYERNLDWFDFWLRCREGQSPIKRAQYPRWEAMRRNAAAGSLCSGQGS